MSSGYDDALTALYQAPHESFVAERKRLAAELKAKGDAAGAARLAKLARPTVSAWVVNQLWWQARAPFQQLFETAAELRAGKLAARAAHRQALGVLSAQARKLLAEGGHAASEGTVRRVEATLSGLAAAGGFAPEPEGALTKDREPPGFEAFGIPNSGDAEASAAAPSEPEPESHASKHHAKAKPAASDHKQTAEAKRREHEAAQRERAAAEAARKRAAEARAKREAERRELAHAVHEAKRSLAERVSARERAAKALAAAEREEAEARTAVERAETELAALAEAD